MFTESSASTPSRLVIEGVVAGLSPVQVTDLFTDPVALTSWWPQRATVDDAGAYMFAWPEIDMVLRGHFVAHQPGERVEFTWQWDNEPDVPVRTVTVTTAPDGTGGTRLTVAHGEYGPDDTEERNGHLEGWQHFLARLADVAEVEA